MSQSPPRSSGPNRALRLGIGVVDRTTDALTFIALVVMVLVISWQVFARFFLGFTPGWASEVALLLLCWLALLATAKGVRERSHIAVGLVVDRMPTRLRSAVARLAPLLMAVFGGYLLVKGGEFTYLMTGSTLPGTGLPTAVQYGALPVAGALILVYSVLQLFGMLPAEAPEPQGEESPDTHRADTPDAPAATGDGAGDEAGPTGRRSTSDDDGSQEGDHR
ncbi:TRAP transporter small permease [Prauserella rugosa]|uniref:TRAP-type C4-dicarboxylate transport system permease small subunit n=1 Tax=Prauserella rugosa TaxID=43354 RepID=A0A660C8I8_9PSEU|nr:TRAP transporter small permease [Prauserella rugosa]TWH19920.1 TRAP-type C4-dicarboxylate transport system permease small subunit [Prauserella rugosa]